MRTDDWLNFHVKFQSIHVNITSTAHHFFFSPFFLLHISKTCQTQKNSKLVKLKKTPCQTQNKCLHTCNVYKYSEKINFLHAFNSFQPEWLLNVMWNMRYMSRETCVTIQRTSEVEEVFQYYFGICPQHQKLTRINTCSWSMVWQCQCLLKLSKRPTFPICQCKLSHTHTHTHIYISIYIYIYIWVLLQCWS